jgi:small-conductance mechanosensitive channel
VINGEVLNVKSFGLTSTKFTRWDGSEIYSPNVKLSSSDIHNVRRSDAMCEGVGLSVGIETTQLQLDNLQKYMEEWISEYEDREIVPIVGIFTKQVYDSRRLDINVGLNHKTHWQNGGGRVARRTRFMLKLIEGVRACGIVLISKPLDLDAAM